MKKLFVNEKAGLSLDGLNLTADVSDRLDLSSFTKSIAWQGYAVNGKPVKVKTITLKHEATLDVYDEDITKPLNVLRKIARSPFLLMRLINYKVQEWKAKMDKLANNQKAKLQTAIYNNELAGKLQSKAMQRALKDGKNITAPKLAYSYGLTLTEFALALAGSALVLLMIFFIEPKVKGFLDQSNITQGISQLMSAIENAKSNNGGSYPEGSITNLGSFAVTPVQQGNSAPGLLGGALCPSLNSASSTNCTNGVYNGWTYACTSSSGPVVIGIYIPSSDQGLVNNIVNYMQNTYSGWTCSSSANMVSCTLSGVICN